MYGLFVDCFVFPVVACCLNPEYKFVEELEVNVDDDIEFDDEPIEFGFVAFVFVDGKAEIDAERNRAKEELRKQVAHLAVVGAERILSREIDSSAHSDIVEKLVTEL